MSARISATSLEYVRVPVQVKEGSVNVNPINDTVRMAFIPKKLVTPVAGDWKVATWEVDGLTYYARCLVGPGGAATLTPGKYYVWVKIVDNPEVPEKVSDYLRVT